MNSVPRLNQTTLRVSGPQEPTAYLLDVCSIAHIKAYLSTKDTKDERHRESIRELRELDLAHNGVSCLPALMEKASDPRSKFSAEDFVLEALRDWGAMRDFFKHARVLETKNFVERYASEMFGVHPEQSMPEYLSFLEVANSKGLHNKIAEGKRIEMAQALCDSAQELGISTSHPVVLVPVAVVYGSEDARKVMKFSGNSKKFNPGNALGDILSISRVSGTITKLVQNAGASGGPFKTAKFQTADSPLCNMLRCFAMRTTLGEAANEFTATIDAPRLFPALFGEDGDIKSEDCRAERDRLYDLLGAKAPISERGATWTGTPPSKQRTK